jgi:branched-chain amino acid transport system ATP-binding protein
LFNLIIGQLRCDSGKVFFDNGRDITNLIPHRIARQGIGTCFQISKIFPGLSVLDNIQVTCIVREGKSYRWYSSGSKMLREEALAILERVGLCGKSAEYASNLSYADQRCLELGITLATGPKLILLDEPTAGISPAETKSLMNLIIGQCKEKGQTIIFIEHDMNVVFEYAERIIVMNYGKIIKDGTPEEVSKDPEVQRIYLGR